ncbi:MAG: transporter [Enterobacterales bacterium]|nr:transporter [Enterobacterales bacterium]
MKQATYNYRIAIAILLLLSPNAKSATCSCAGVSLTNTVNLTQFNAEQWQLSISFTQSDISDLVAGTNQINDETGRFRETDSLILGATYGINENWALSAIVSKIEHRRRNAIANQRTETSSGLGDSMLLVSYAPKKISPFNRNEWAYGLAVRIPTGENDAGKPIIFSEDLQPGQGAWGESLWLHYGHAFDQAARWQVYIDANYQVNGNNQRDYSFTNEWNLSAGVSYQLSDSWNFKAGVQYRSAVPHTRFGNNIPNTGGQWVNADIAIDYAINPATHLSLSTIQPLYRDLIGALQFTNKNSYTLSLSTLIE